MPSEAAKPIGEHWIYYNNSHGNYIHFGAINFLEQNTYNKKIIYYMKVCSRCKEEKELSEFHKQSRNADGLRYECKQCAKLRSDEYCSRPEVKEHYKESNAIRYAKTMSIIRNDPTLHDKYLEYCKQKGKRYYKIGNTVVKKAIVKWKKNNPEKVKAKRRITHLKSTGVLPTVKGYDYHHWSYLEEHRSDVIHLTSVQHKCIHRFMVYDKEYFQYRTLEGVLLDTKEKHIDYITKFYLEYR